MSASHSETVLSQSSKPTSNISPYAQLQPFREQMKLPDSAEVLAQVTLCDAAQAGDRGLFVRLLQRGLDPLQADEYGLTPLDHTAAEGHAVLLNYLLKVLRVPPSPRALDLALTHNRLACCSLLVDAKVDVTAAASPASLVKRVALANKDTVAFMLAELPVSLDAANDEAVTPV